MVSYLKEEQPDAKVGGECKFSVPGGAKAGDGVFRVVITDSQDKKTPTEAAIPLTVR